MKILVLGATGMAGHVITIYLKEAGHDVTAFSRRKFDYCKNIIGSITDFGLLKDVIKEGNYDAVINAIGILNQSAEDEKTMAILLNSYLPHYLCEITKELKTKVILISTDCVFSGNKGGYAEDSVKDGETFYDRTKALGEVVDNKNLTFRNSIIGPDCNKHGIGLFNWFMRQKEEVLGYTEAIWTGVTTLTLAKAIESSLQENLTGLYNLVNNKNINKYELMLLFNEYMENEKMKIIPDNKVKINKSLVNNRNDFSFKVPDYEDMIIEMKEWIENHKELYPHYFE